MPAWFQTVHASGGKNWDGPTPASANHFLKWAFVEAANVITTRQKVWADKHVVRLYERLKANKCHGKAATVVVRHLAHRVGGFQARNKDIGSQRWHRVLVQERVSATAILAPQEAVRVIAKPGAKTLMPEVRADR